jgi:L-cysteine/cystine lyase
MNPSGPVVMLRELCPALEGKTYFNYGGQGPLPDPSLAAMVESWCTIQQLGPSTDVWPFIAQETAPGAPRLWRR